MLLGRRYPEGRDMTRETVEAMARETLVAKIYFKDCLVSILLREYGKSKIEIAYRNENPGNFCPRMYLDEFVACVELAGKKLDEALRSE